jgi:hypothetical protein
MAERATTVEAGIWRGWPLVLALVCGGAAYSDSLRGPFIFDDIDSILNNPHVNRALPEGKDVPTSLRGRPVLTFSFEVDYAIGGMDVRVYHFTNLVIHLGCGVVLFGIMRRNFFSAPLWGGRFEHSSHWLAGAVVAIWLVHPLNTEAVTLVVQRAESLAGLFYLLVIYCLIRGWNAAVVAACVLGLGTKEVVATAPVMALLYDRTFLAGSFLAAIRARKWLYFTLAGMLVVFLLGVVLSGARSQSVGNILPGDYLITQMGVIAHYVALAFWPRGLVLDYYDWPVAHGVSEISVGGWLVVITIVATVVALKWKPWLGFLGAWFFGILAPSSSVIPVFTEVAAEHRMYLPLIALVVLVVVGGWVLFSRNLIGCWVAGMIYIVVLAGLSGLTYLRNAEYRNAVVIWQDAVEARPGNPRAYFNLGYSELMAGQARQAEGEFRRALELEPDYVAAARLLWKAMGEAGESSTRPDGQSP